MATNPMQRKAKISFFLGMLLALLIGGAVAFFLIMKIKTLDAEIASIQGAKKSVYVLNQDVKSGQLITEEMCSIKSVDGGAVPANATSDIETTLNSYSLRDKQNHIITMQAVKESTSDANGSATSNTATTQASTQSNSYAYYIKINNKDLPLYKLDGNGSEERATVLTVDDKAYYYENDNKNGNKVDIEIINNAVVAKVDIKSNTIITSSLITRSDLINKDDVRIQEYNMLVLPTDLENGDYVDVRLLLPNGQDFIVVSKKEVSIPMLGTEYIAGTIDLKLAEEEILSMGSAIVEAFRMDGSKLYVTKYAEAGMQEAAQTTYPINAEVAKLIESDSNVLQDALNGLRKRYNADVRNTTINDALTNNGKIENLYQKMEESITSTKESREQYLQSLSGGAVTE